MAQEKNSESKEIAKMKTCFIFSVNTMDRKVLMGLMLGVLGVGLVIGIAFGILHTLNKDSFPKAEGEDGTLILDLEKINAREFTTALNTCA